MSQPYSPAADLFCIEPREDDHEPSPELEAGIHPNDPTPAEQKAAFWAKLAGNALREAHEAQAIAKAAISARDALCAERDDLAKACATLTLDLIERGDERDALCRERDALEDRLTMLRDVALLAVDARRWDDEFSYELHTSLLVTNLAGPAAVGVRGSVALSLVAKGES